MTLKSPKGLHTRPTSSRTREAIWNSLAPYIEGARILDLFAGSGAVGIEGLSRGAQSCVFVERAPSALQALRANMAEAQRRAEAQGLAVETRVYSHDVMRYAGLIPSEGFSLIWLDPPYDELTGIFPKLWQPVWSGLAQGGICLIESDAAGAELVRQVLADKEQSELLQKQKPYGKTWVSFIYKE